MTTELQIISKQVVLPAKFEAGLTETDKRYIFMYSCEKIATIEKESVMAILRDAIKGVYFSSGIQVPGLSPDEQREHLDMLTLDVYNKLMMSQRFVSIEEIKEAWRMGVLKELGVIHYGTISTVFLIDCVSAFRAKQDRIAVIEKYNKLLLSESEKKEPTHEEKQKISEQAIKDSFENFKRTGEVLNMGNAVFRALWLSGKIRFDQKKADELKEQARLILTNQLILKRNKAKENMQRGEVTTIEEQLMDIEDDNNQSLLIMAGTLAVKEYFEKDESQ